MKEGQTVQEENSLMPPRLLLMTRRRIGASLHPAYLKTGLSSVPPVKRFIHGVGYDCAERFTGSPQPEDDKRTG